VPGSPHRTATPPGLCSAAAFASDAPSFHARGFRPIRRRESARESVRAPRRRSMCMKRLAAQRKTPSQRSLDAGRSDGHCPRTAGGTIVVRSEHPQGSGRAVAWSLSPTSKPLGAGSIRPCLRGARRYQQPALVYPSTSAPRASQPDCPIGIKSPKYNGNMTDLRAEPGHRTARLSSIAVSNLFTLSHAARARRNQPQIAVFPQFSCTSRLIGTERG